MNKHEAFLREEAERRTPTWGAFAKGLTAAADEIKRLEALIEPLPKFDDGVIAYPGMAGWHPCEEEPGTVGETGCTCGNDEWGAGVEECYSTHKAAESAAAAAAHHAATGL